MQYSAGMTEEIRRRKTSDPEMDAIYVIAQALEPLDRSACERVVKWAEERYVRIRLPGLDVGDMQGVNKFFEATAKMASRLNMADSQVLLNAMGRVAEELPSEGEHVPG